MPTSIINPNSIVTIRALLDGARQRVFSEYDPGMSFPLYQDLHPETRNRMVLKRWLEDRWDVYAAIMETPNTPAARALMERAWVHGNVVAFLGERITGFRYLHEYVFNDDSYEWVADAFEMSKYGEARGIMHDIAEALSWGLFILLDSPRWTDEFCEDLLKDRYMPFLGLMVHLTTDMLGAKNFPETFLSK